MAIKQQSEDLLERIVFDLSVAITEAESGRVPDTEFRSRMGTLCRKWRAYIETLVTSAADPALDAASKMLALQEENAALRRELEAAKNENTALRSEIAKPPEQPPAKQSKPAPAAKPAEPEDKSEFGEAMKGVKRY